MTQRSTAGLALGDVFVGFIALLLLGLLLQGCSRRARRQGAANECYANLNAIGAASSSYLLDHGGKFVTDLSTNAGGSREFRTEPSAAFRHFQPLVRDWLPSRFLVCPVDNRRSASTWQALRNHNISYFLSLSFAPTQKPGLWAGDRNIVERGNSTQLLSPDTTTGWHPSAGLHRTNGFVLFMDGHAEFLDSAKLVKAIISQGRLTNYIVVP